MLLTNTRFLDETFHLRYADIRIHDAHIVEIDEQLEPLANEAVIDCSSYLLYPGLIDAHVHTPDTLLRGIFCDMSLHQWGDQSEQGQLQQRLFDYLDQHASKTEFLTLVQYAYLQYLKNGVACIIETGQADDSCLMLEKGALQVGIKALVDWYDEAVASDLMHTNLRRGTHLPEEEDLEQYSLELTVKRVRETGWPLMTHCLETEFRRQESLRKFGCSTVKLLDEYQLLGPNTILFHCIETDEEDRRLLAKSQAHLVHCPVSNQLASEHRMALDELLQRGSHLGLGTDFLTHDLWEVMRCTYRELKTSDNPDRYDAATVWKMATNSPCPDLYQGSIAVGNSADLLFIRDNSRLSPLLQLSTFSNAAFNTLMYTQQDMIEHVMISGSFALFHGKSPSIDEVQLENDYQALLETIFSKDLIQQTDRELQ
ncbi:amidohydrolase family protein [Sphaerochaeta sp.]|uniref:amidohydrolase family protein n=1 Tax=Sphaerochaeta sp. TaxID=1972642 RepID=UPI002FC7FCBD